MAGIQIGRVTIGSPDGWVFERQDGGGVLYNAAYQTPVHRIVGKDAPRVEAWLLGKTDKPALPDDVREYLRRRVREWTCIESMDLLAKYPKE